MIGDGGSIDAGRRRPGSTVLDTLRTRIDLSVVDVVAFGLRAVAADLGYGDVRPVPGSIAWVDHLREEGKRTAVVGDGDRTADALALAGVSDRFDVVTSGEPGEALRAALDQLGADPERALAVDVTVAGIAAAKAAGVRLAIGVARGAASPEEQRRAGADAVVADLQELLGPFSPAS